MTAFTKLAMAAAAVAAVALIAIIAMPRGSGGIGGPTPSPLLTPSPSPAPTASPSTPGIALLDGKAGTHVGQVDGVQATLTFPGGWVTGIAGRDGGYVIDKAVSTGEASIFLWNPDNVYADPCARTKMSPPVGRSAADFATAATKISGIRVVAAPSDVTVGGRPGKLVAIAVPEKAACQAGQSGFHLWYNQDSGDDCSGDVECGRFATALGDTIRVWTVDVDADRVIFEAETPKGSSPDLDAEIQRIVDSITFE